MEVLENLISEAQIGSLFEAPMRLRKLPQKSFNVSGPVRSYHPRLKNYWYLVAFTTDLKDNTMEGMIWIWPGDDPPTAGIPSLLPPSGCQIHAEIVMELLIEHGLLLDNLSDLAHAPLTHTSTFQLGEIFDSCIWPPRIQGHLSHRYGVPTTLYGAVNHHWHLEAWEIGGKDHQAACNSSSPTSCLPTFINKENKKFAETMNCSSEAGKR